MMSTDPVKRGLNAYRYCDNDPVNYVDPTGEITGILIGAVVGGLGSAGFYGAGRAVEVLRGSVGGRKSGVGRLIPGTEGTVTGGDSTQLGRNMTESMGMPKGTKWSGYQAQHIIPADDISAMSRHRGYHSTYNGFVRTQLDRIDVNQSVDVIQKQVFDLQQNLKYLQQSGLPLYPSQGATLDLWKRSLERIQ